MTFHYSGRTAWLWFAICVGNAALSGWRLHRHGWHPGFDVVQFLTWILMASYWFANCTVLWHFEADALRQTRLGIFVSRVPYGEMVSVEQLRGGDAARIHYGGRSMFTQPSTLTVSPNDMPRFLEQLERRAPALSAV